MSTQKAIAVTAVGKPAELVIWPIPKPSPTQVQLRVTVTALNPHDGKLRDWGLFTDREKLPAILGNDVAGIVTEVGSDVTKFKVGDRVVTYATLFAPGHPQKGLQEYTVADEDYTTHIPDGFTDDDAATIPVNLTAGAVGLYDESGLGIPEPWSEEAKTFDYAGTTILIIGGGSNCGRFAVQLAKIGGIGKIVTLGGSEAELKKWGATHVLNRHGSDEEIQARIRDVVGDDLEYCYDAINPPETQYVGINALSNSKKGKYATVLPIPLSIAHTASVTKKEDAYEMRKVQGMPHFKAVGKGLWANLGRFIKDGKIVPLKYEAFEGLDAAKINEVLDEYRDGKRNVQPHFRISK